MVSGKGLPVQHEGERGESSKPATVPQPTCSGGGGGDGSFWSDAMSRQLGQMACSMACGKLRGKQDEDEDKQEAAESVQVADSACNSNLTELAHCRHAINLVPLCRTWCSAMSLEWLDET
jgi:hypothetical protein